MLQVPFLEDSYLKSHFLIYNVNTYGVIEEDLLEYIIKYYDKGNIIPKEIFVPEVIDTSLLEEYLNTKVSIPKKGDIKNLINLACSNAKDVLNEKIENIKRNDDMKELMGKEVDFIISEYNPKKNRVIGDRRSLLLEAENKKKEEALSKLHEGDIVEGTVVNVAAYGAFVDLGGVDGLLHSTEMGWGKRQNPAKVFKVGDKVKVMISEMKDGRISLTARFPEENPWTLARTNYAIGKVVKGTVARITPYGAFVSLDPYIDALLHISELRYEKVPKVEDLVKVGDVIEAKVIDFNEKEGKIALSIKALLPVPEKVKEEEAEVADVDIESYAKKMDEQPEEQ